MSESRPFTVALLTLEHNWKLELSSISFFICKLTLMKSQSFISERSDWLRPLDNSLWLIAALVLWGEWVGQEGGGVKDEISHHP